MKVKRESFYCNELWLSVKHKNLTLTSSMIIIVVIITVIESSNISRSQWSKTKTLPWKLSFQLLFSSEKNRFPISFVIAQFPKDPTCDFNCEEIIAAWIHEAKNKNAGKRAAHIESALKKWIAQKAVLTIISTYKSRSRYETGVKRI